MSFIAWIAAASSLSLLYHAMGRPAETQNLTPVYTSVTGKKYWVLKSPNQQEAADFMGTIEKTLEDFIGLLKRNVATYDKEMQEGVHHLLESHERRKGFNLLELDASLSPHLAYNRNKSEYMFICIREDPSVSMQLGRLDTILYIMIHELAHSMLPSFAPLKDGRTVHDETFRRHEAFLMAQANQHGFLNPRAIPHREHCGRIIPDPRDAQ
jgi:hypothetical protein